MRDIPGQIGFQNRPRHVGREREISFLVPRIFRLAEESNRSYHGSGIERRYTMTSTTPPTPLVLKSTSNVDHLEFLSPFGCSQTRKVL